MITTPSQKYNPIMFLPLFFIPEKQTKDKSNQKIVHLIANLSGFMEHRSD